MTDRIGNIVGTAPQRHMLAADMNILSGFWKRINKIYDNIYNSRTNDQCFFHDKSSFEWKI